MLMYDEYGVMEFFKIESPSFIEGHTVFVIDSKRNMHAKNINF